MNRLFYAICHRLALSRYFSKIKWSEEGVHPFMACLLYTSDAADDSLRLDLGGRRIIKKKRGAWPVYASAGL